MKKLIAVILISMALCFICPMAFAEGESDEFLQLKEQIDSRLKNALDEETAEELDGSGITPSDAAGLTDLDQRTFFADLWDKFRSSLADPLVMLGRILAVSLIYSAMTLLCSDSGGLDGHFGTLCVMCVITVMADALSSSFQALQSSINTINTFMISYIPVFAAVTTAGGHAATAGVYSASTILVCEAAELIASRLLIPFLSSVTAITIVSAIDPQLKISGVADSIRRLTTWLLATVMLVFVGLLTIQGVTGSAADTLTSRTLRFAASSFIPVIGGSVSDAFLAVKSGMGVIRSAVGGFGLLAVFLIAVRPFMLLFSMKLVLWAGRIANELLGLQRTADLLRSVNSVLSIGVSILIAITSAFLISTAAMMAVMNTGG